MEEREQQADQRVAAAEARARQAEEQLMSIAATLRSGIAACVRNANTLRCCSAQHHIVSASWLVCFICQVDGRLCLMLPGVRRTARHECQFSEPLQCLQVVRSLLRV